MSRFTAVRRSSLATLALLLAAALFTAPAEAKKPGSSPPPTPSPTPEPTPLPGGVFTLHAVDPLSSVLCFADNQGGRVLVDGNVYARCSDLDFGTYLPDGFTAGFAGALQAVLLDLGTDLDIRRRYPSAPFGFTSIRLDQSRSLLLVGQGTGQPMAETSDLFAAPDDYSSSRPAQLGHVYVLRTTSLQDPAFELTVKFLVIEHAPGGVATIRWYRL